jgi:hypothetical protein
MSVYETDANATIEGKFLTNAARLALIFHVAELIEKGTPLSELTPVSGETMRNACVVTEWFTNEAKRIYATFAGAPVAGDLTAAQKEVMKVLQIWEPATEGELRKRSRVLRKMENLEEVLQQLVDLKIIRPNTRKGNGVEGREIVEYSIIRPTAVPEPPANLGDFEGSGYAYTCDSPQNDFSPTDRTEIFADDQPTESAAAPEVNLSELADIVRATLIREPGKNAVFFESDILSVFNDDRVAASEFLRKHGFEVEEIDGQQRVVEPRLAEPTPEPSSNSESENSESASEPPIEQLEATEFRCEDCQHFSGREISPRGLCHVGIVQQNRPDCHRFKLLSK